MSWNKDAIIPLLLQAGETARGLKKSLEKELKHDRSLVTQADREVESLISTALERPERGVYFIGEETVGEKSEEYIAQALAAETYIVDPIDGTAPYAHGLPNWGVSVGHMSGGRIDNGAVYLPDFGELLVTEGPQVLEGRLEAGAWSWRVLPQPRGRLEDSDLVAITQAVAKRGRVLLRNPVQVLGAAVVPLVGLVQGRFGAYLGSVKLWDVAGALALILRCRDFSITVNDQGRIRRVGAEVSSDAYILETGHPERWYFHSDLLICHREDEDRVRKALVLGESIGNRRE